MKMDGSQLEILNVSQVYDITYFNRGTSLLDILQLTRQSAAKEDYRVSPCHHVYKNFKNFMVQIRADILRHKIVT